MSSSNSPCAACKFQRRKCTPDCVYAPYFPPEEREKFASVHKVFGASNVATILREINAAHRQYAVDSLAYEAAARLQDPIYGCVGTISILQQRLKQVRSDLYNARTELAHYLGPSAMFPVPFNNPSPYNASPVPYNAQFGQQMVDAQQMAAIMAAREQQEMLRNYNEQYQQQQQQQQQHDQLARINGGFEQAGGFNQMSGADVDVSPSLALGSFDNHYQQIQQQPHYHDQLQQPQAPQQQQRSESEDDQSAGPSGWPP